MPLHEVPVPLQGQLIKTGQRQDAELGKGRRKGSRNSGFLESGSPTRTRTASKGTAQRIKKDYLSGCREHLPQRSGAPQSRRVHPSEIPADPGRSPAWLVRNAETSDYFIVRTGCRNHSPLDSFLARSSYHRAQPAPAGHHLLFLLRGTRLDHGEPSQEDQEGLSRTG